MEGYGMIVVDEISPHFIGLVFHFIKVIERYVEIENEYPAQFIRLDCIKIIDEKTYNFLLSRNDIIKKWIEERDKKASPKKGYEIIIKKTKKSVTVSITGKKIKRVFDSMIAIDPEEKSPLAINLNNGEESLANIVLSPKLNIDGLKIDFIRQG